MGISALVIETWTTFAGDLAIQGSIPRRVKRFGSLERPDAVRSSLSLGFCRRGKADGA